MSQLKDISVEYERAEVTCIFLHNKTTNKKTNLLTVFELVPIEQQSSLMIGDKSSSYMNRESVDGIYSIYIARLVSLTVNDAIYIYEKIEAGLKLNYDKLDVEIEVPFLLVQEPPNYFNLLINANDEKTLGRILPKRNTCLRVWSKLNTDKEWLKAYDKKLLEKLTKISRDHLGYDLSAIPEHIGNVYLCASNPFIRKWNTSLLDKEKDLLVSFYERTGKSIIGGKIVIEEERSKNIGFTITRIIANKEERITLPYFPDALNEKVYDASGQLLEHSYGMWCNIQFNMHIQENVLNLNVQTENGIEVYSVPKTSMAASTTVGKFDFSTARYLRNALNNRRFEELESSKEFIFFPKHETTKSKAQSTVRELLNKAHKRCIILDPYFGPMDLVFALTIQNISIPIRIISSAMVLKMEVETIVPKKRNKFQKFCNCVAELFKEAQKGKTNAEQLNESIKQFQTQYPLQKIQCKVLKGKKSPLHDRYIVIDDDVYLLGSSLNEFGARATTIIKVPTPIKMIEQAEEWWADNDCPYLDDFIIKQED
jgi:hypothetical protein